MKIISDSFYEIFVALGGFSVIVIGLSSWLGKLWAQRIIEKEKVLFQKDINNYKAQLDIKLANINTANEKSIIVTKLQYEKEFAIY